MSKVVIKFVTGGGNGGCFLFQCLMTTLVVVSS
jgi:hypothetical protein